MCNQFWKRQSRDGLETEAIAWDLTFEVPLSLALSLSLSRARALSLSPSPSLPLPESGAWDLTRGVPCAGTRAFINLSKDDYHPVIDSVEGHHESRRCSRDTYPESDITSILVYEKKHSKSQKISPGNRGEKDKGGC